MKTQWSLAGISILRSKRAQSKLGGFTYAFAEITNVMNLEPGFPCGKTRFRKTFYIPPREKSSPRTGNPGFSPKKK